MTENKNLKKIVKTDALGNTVPDNGPYIQALFNVLDACRDVVEYAQNKRNALWIFANVLSSISWTVYNYDRTVQIAMEISQKPESEVSKRTREYWTERLLDAEKVVGVVRLFEEFGKVYEKQVIDYTSDNLGDLITQLPTVEDMLKKHQSSSTQQQKTVAKQQNETLKFLAEKLSRK